MDTYRFIISNPAYRSQKIVILVPADSYADALEIADSIEDGNPKNFYYRIADYL